jgi:hypothetical protein
MQLAVCRNEGGIATFFSGKSHRQIEQDEAAIASCGVPYTIVRPGSLRDEPGGQLGFDFVQVCWILILGFHVVCRLLLWVRLQQEVRVF